MNMVAARFIEQRLMIIHSLPSYNKVHSVSSEVYPPENDEGPNYVQHFISLEPGVPYNGTVVAINQVGHGQGDPQLFYTRELGKI